VILDARLFIEVQYFSFMYLYEDLIVLRAVSPHQCECLLLFSGSVRDPTTNTRPTSNTTGNNLTKFTGVQLNERVVNLRMKTVTVDVAQSFVNSESVIKSTNCK